MDKRHEQHSDNLNNRDTLSNHADLRPPALLSVEEAAQLVGISRSTAYKLMNSGLWKSVKLGRLRRVSRNWLENWLRSIEQEGR